MQFKFAQCYAQVMTKIFAKHKKLLNTRILHSLIFEVEKKFNKTHNANISVKLQLLIVSSCHTSGSAGGCLGGCNGRM